MAKLPQPPRYRSMDRPPRRSRRTTPSETVRTDAANVRGMPDLEAYRRRMNAIGEALSAVFVGMESADSDLWGRGIYLKLVGKLYEALNSEDLSLEELQVVSKMISEQRRAQAQAGAVERRSRVRSADPRASARTDRTAPRASARADAPRHAHESHADGSSDDVGPSLPPALPAHLGEVVKQLYGVNLQSSAGR